MKLSHGLLAGALLAVSLVAGISLNKQLNAPKLPDFTTAYVLPDAVTLPAFNLGEAQAFTNTQFQDKWSLVFFGYGSCPDVCPTELYNLNNVAKLMADANKEMPQVVFISVDPKRDSNDMLASYAKFYNDDFIGLTGDSSEIDKLANKFGVIYQKTFLANNGQYVSVPYNSPLPADQENTYLINHSSRVYLVSPEGDYVAAFAPPHSAEKIAADLVKL